MEQDLQLLPFGRGQTGRHWNIRRVHLSGKPHWLFCSKQCFLQNHIHLIRRWEFTRIHVRAFWLCAKSSHKQIPTRRSIFPLHASNRVGKTSGKNSLEMWIRFSIIVVNKQSVLILSPVIPHVSFFILGRRVDRPFVFRHSWECDWVEKRGSGRVVATLRPRGTRKGGRNSHHT